MYIYIYIYFNSKIELKATYKLYFFKLVFTINFLFILYIKIELVVSFKSILFIIKLPAWQLSFCNSFVHIVMLEVTTIHLIFEFVYERDLEVILVGLVTKI
jgi:hypothetical protein